MRVPARALFLCGAALGPAAAAQLPPDPGAPPATLLYQNFPNPFPVGAQDRTCISFDLAAPGMVALDVLDLRGNAVRRLVPSAAFAAPLAPGRYGRDPAGGPGCDPRLTWDGTTAHGTTVPPGVYLIRLQAPGVNAFRRIVFRGEGR